MSNKTLVTMYGGTRTIGGVVAEIIYGTDRVICEIGTGYNPSTDIYDGVVRRRDSAWLEDALLTGEAPPVPDLYPGRDESLNTAVFVSHLHLDHMSAMGFVDDSVPVYIAEPALRIEQALQTIGEGVHPNHTNYRYFTADNPVKIGEIEVLPLLIRTESYWDHSFVIKTPDATIHYTGDLALHGNEPELVWQEMDRVASMDIDLQLIDVTAFMDSTLEMIYGTNTPVIESSREIPCGMLSESEAFAIYEKALPPHRGAAVVNFYERETDFITQFSKLAESCGRSLVLEPETGYIMWKVTGQRQNIAIPDVKRYHDKQPEWLAELSAESTIVQWSDIKASPSKYLVQITYANSVQMFELRDLDGLYIHADGVPIGSFDPAYDNLMRVIDLANFEYVTSFQENYFGHGYPSQVKYYAEQIHARVIWPVHSYNPERFSVNTDSICQLPELGVTYEVNSKGVRVAGL